MRPIRPTISEKPVLWNRSRDRFDLHQAYEGWRPTEPAKVTAGGLVFTILAAAGLAWMLVRSGA